MEYMRHGAEHERHRDDCGEEEHGPEPAEFLLLYPVLPFKEVFVPLGGFGPVPGVPYGLYEAFYCHLGRQIIDVRPFGGEVHRGVDHAVYPVEGVRNLFYARGAAHAGYGQDYGLDLRSRGWSRFSGPHWLLHLFEELGRGLVKPPLAPRAAEVIGPALVDGGPLCRGLLHGHAAARAS